MAEGSFTERAQRTGRRLVRQDRYVLVLFLILATLISSAFLGDGTFGILVPLAFMSLTLAVTLSTSDAGPKAVFLGRVVVGLAFLGVAAAELLNYNGLARLGFFVAMIVLSIVTPLVIARRLLKHMTVSIGTIAGAADIYLLIGLFFAVVFMSVGASQAGVLNAMEPDAVQQHATAADAFFIASRPVGPADFIYYSLVTQTTVGYGDLTASSNLGRMLSTTEALLGQLYLVTVVAVLVANIGRSRTTPLLEHGEGLEAAEESQGVTDA